MKIDNLPVTNANRPIKLAISAKDIKGSRVRNPKACVAARAAVRTIPGCTAAKVHASRTFVKIGNKWVRYNTPHSLRNEIIAFDRGGSFEPGEYRLKPLDKKDSTRFGRAHAYNAPSHGRPGHRRRRHIVLGIRKNGHTGVQLSH